MMLKKMSRKAGSGFVGNFKKDILLIDTEFSGFDLDKHELLQVAAILLDKKTLKEKKSFSTYIRPTPARWKHRNRSAMAVNRITWEQVKNAPSLKNALRKFDKTFGHDVIQAFYVGYNDKRFLMDGYRRAGLKWQFDYHYFELWGFFYPFLAVQNRLTSIKDFAGFGIEAMLKMFKIPQPDNLHDALTDCRVEAEILRKAINQMK